MFFILEHGVYSGCIFSEASSHSPSLLLLDVSLQPCMTTSRDIVALSFGCLELCFVPSLNMVIFLCEPFILYFNRYSQDRTEVVAGFASSGFTSISSKVTVVSL